MEPTSACMESGCITKPPLPTVTTLTLMPLLVGDAPVYVCVEPPAVLAGVPVWAKAAPAKSRADVTTEENNMSYCLGSLTD